MNVAHIIRLKKILLVALCGFAAIGSRAQTTAFTYQGRVTDNGANFTGAGQFGFSLFTVTNTSSRATAIANSIDFNGGGLNGIQVTSGGNGYLTPPAVTITSSTGSGATAGAVLSGGSVSAINIVTEGTGYSPSLGVINAQVTIAPPPDNFANITLWNNDGAAGSQPAAPVNLPVANGLFTVILGSTAVTNMTALPSSIFSQYSYPDLYLQIWFNDGVHGLAALSPAQPVTTVPVATFANTASNLLGTLPAGQLTGAVPTGSLTSLPAANLTGPVPAASLTSVPAASVTGLLTQTNLGTNNSYTVTIGDGTHNFSTSTQSGFYTVVGNLVHVEIWLQWTSKGSAVAGSNLQVSLPFPVVSTRAPFTPGFFSGLTFAGQLTAGANNTASNILLYGASNSGGAPSTLTVANCSATGEIQISGTYRWH